MTVQEVRRLNELVTHLLKESGVSARCVLGKETRSLMHKLMHDYDAVQDMQCMMCGRPQGWLDVTMKGDNPRCGHCGGTLMSREP